MNPDGVTLGSAGADVALLCPDCRQPIPLTIPVVIRVTRVGERHESISAQVDNSQEWQQPVWDHQLFAHGPEVS